MKADVEIFTCGEIINVNIYRLGNQVPTSADKLDLIMDDKLSESTWRKRSSSCRNYYHFYSWYFQI